MDSLMFSELDVNTKVALEFMNDQKRVKETTTEKKAEAL